MLHEHTQGRGVRKVPDVLCTPHEEREHNKTVSYSLEFLGSPELFYAYEHRLLAEHLEEFDLETQERIKDGVARKTKGMIESNINGVLLPWFEERFGFPYSDTRRRLDLLRNRFEADAIRPQKLATERAFMRRVIATQQAFRREHGIDVHADHDTLIAEKRLSVQEWWKKFARIEARLLGSDVFINRELIIKMGETVADLYQLLRDLKGNVDDVRFEGLRQCFERSFAGNLAGVQVLFGFFEYIHNQDIVEHGRERGIPSKKIRALKGTLTEYLSQIHRYIEYVAPEPTARPPGYRPTDVSERAYHVQNNANLEHMRCLWETLLAVAPERRFVNQIKNAVLSERAAFGAFEVMGYHPKPATPHDDAERMVDFWVGDNIPVQVTTGAYCMMTVLDAQKRVLYKTPFSESALQQGGGDMLECMRSHEKKEVSAREKWFGPESIAPFGVIVTLPKEVKGSGDPTYNPYTGRPSPQLVAMIRAEFNNFRRKNP